MTNSSRDVLNGTTRRVYRFIYRNGPVRLRDIQSGLGLSSPSVSDYHVQKLVRMGLIRQEGDGFAVDRIFFESMLRIRRTVIPLWTTATAFFGAALLVLITILRPININSTFLFSLSVYMVALSISVYETVKSFSDTP